MYQQADAAKRAFDRADALVTMAQSYLRGDRPNRSPVEVTVTIPASILRSEEVDSVEVGEHASDVSRAVCARLPACSGLELSQVTLAQRVTTYAGYAPSHTSS